MSKAARDLASLRKKVRHVCPECKKKFKALKTAIYCSNACRQKAKYRRATAGDSPGTDTPDQTMESQSG